MTDYEYGRLHVDHSEVFSDFFTIHLLFDINVSVKNNGRALECTVINNRTTYAAGSSTGIGFINFAGFIWGDPTLNRRQLAWVPEGSYPRPEGMDAVVTQMSSVSNGMIPNSVLWGVAQSDKDPAIKRIWQENTHTFTLTDSDFDSAGNLKNRTIIRYASRWYDNSSSTNDHATSITTGDEYTISLNQLRDWYYPWSVRKGDIWSSCNRSGGSFRIRKAGAWSDAKNESRGYGVQKAFIRNGSSWNRLPKTGKE